MGAGAVTVAGGALVAAACCVLPLFLPAVAVTAAGGLLASIAGAHAWLAGAAVVFVLMGWAWMWRRSARTGRRPAIATLAAMGAATALAALALIWPLIEPHVLRLVGAP